MTAPALTTREAALVRLAVREAVRVVDPRREWLTVPEACRMTGLSRSFVWELMTAGQLPFAQINPRAPRRIRADALDEFMARYEGRVGPG